MAHAAAQTFEGCDDVPLAGRSWGAVAALVVSNVAVLGAVFLQVFAPPSDRPGILVTGLLFVLGVAGAKVSWRGATTRRRTLRCPACSTTFLVSVGAAGVTPCRGCHHPGQIPRRTFPKRERSVSAPS